MAKVYEKKVSVGAWLKKGLDFKDGDLVELASEGQEVQGEFGLQNVFLIKAGEKEGNVSINQTSINGFIDAFGKEAVNWISKKVKVVKIKQNVSGKFIDVYYFSHPDAELTESGFIIPKKGEPDIASDEEVKAEDIPF